jgi:hypothetical protein
MRYLTLLIILNTFLWSANLTKHRISESEDRVDIMLYFDTPYDRQIIKKRESNSILIILPQVKSKYKISNHINSSIIQSFKAISYKNQTMLELHGVDKFSVNTMSTIDNYGLRLRVEPLLETSTKLYPNKNKTQNRVTEFRTKDDTDMVSESIKVLLALFWVFAALFLLKTWVAKKRGKDIDISKWFPKKTKEKVKTKEIQEVKKELKEKKEEPKKEEKKTDEVIIVEAKKEEKKITEVVAKPKQEEKKATEIVAKPKQEEKKSPPPEDPFQIVFQKHIDKQNTVSLLEYNGNNYLILTGNTNMLLEMNAKTQAGLQGHDQEIQNILKQNDKNFNDFIQLQNTKFNEYKRKASQDAPIKIGASS